MNKIINKLRVLTPIHRLFFFFVLVSLVLFAPIVSVAKNNIPETSITFDKNSHSLNLSIDTKKALSYEITYDTGAHTNGIMGSSNGGSSFHKSFFIGTCSSHGKCVYDPIKKGDVTISIPSLHVRYTIHFSVENDRCHEDSRDDHSDENGDSDDDHNYCHNGEHDEHHNENSCHGTPTPTPTRIPTVTPTPTIVVTPTVSPTPTSTPTPTVSPTAIPSPTPTQAPRSQSSTDSQGSSSSSNTTSADSARPTPCTDEAPYNAPGNFFATAGINTVTLNWTRPNGPVSYYLVAFGTNSAADQYGNSNVGNQDTTKYTVTGLSGGTYYFKLRAGNGCKPGPFTAAITVSPSGKTFEAPPSGFQAGVLGASDEAKLATKSADVKGAAIALSTQCIKCLWWPFLLAEFIALGVYVYTFAKKQLQKAALKHAVSAAIIGGVAYILFVFFNKCIQLFTIGHTGSFICDYFLIIDLALAVCSYAYLLRQLRNNAK